MNEDPKTEQKPVRENWLTLREAAELMNVHPRTLARWVHAGKLFARKTPGGQWRTTKASLMSMDMTVPEFAEAVGVTPQTVRRWVHAGDIDALQQESGRILIPVAEIQRMGARRRRKPRKAARQAS